MTAMLKKIFVLKVSVRLTAKMILEEPYFTWCPSLPAEEHSGKTGRGLKRERSEDCESLSLKRRRPADCEKKRAESEFET